MSRYITRSLADGVALHALLRAFLMGCVLCMLTLMVKSDVHAQSSPAPPQAEAFQAAVAAGIAAFSAQHYLEAREQFARAHVLEPSARTLRTLALTDFALDEYTLARREIAAALAHTTRPLSDEQRRELEELRSWMDSNLGRVHLRVSPASATAYVDGKPVDAGEILLPAGEYHLRVVADGFVAEERVLHLQVSTSPHGVSIDLASRPPATIAAHAAAAPVRTAQASTTWLWVGGAGVAAAAIGGVLYGVGRNTLADVEAARGAQYVSAETGYAQLQRGRWLTGIGLAVGGVGLASAAISLILKSKASSDSLQLSIGDRQLSIRRVF